MRKLIPILIVLLSPWAFAKTQSNYLSKDDSSIGVTVVEPKPSFSDHLTLIGGLGLSSFDYKESVNPPLKSTESATLVTFSIGAEKIFSPDKIDPTVFRLNLSYSPTNTTYVGSTQKGEPVPATVTEGSRFFNFETSALFPLSNPLYGYVGIGYRSWVRALPGFAEHYRWGYLPLGLVYKVPLKENNVTLDFDGSFRPMFMGKMSIYSTETAASESYDLDLGSKVGTKLQAHLGINAGEQSAIIVNPWYEYSAISESNLLIVKDNNDGTAFGIKEPSSTTYQYGINVSYAFNLQ